MEYYSVLVLIGHFFSPVNQLSDHFWCCEHFSMDISKYLGEPPNELRDDTVNTKWYFIYGSNNMEHFAWNSE